MSSLSPDDLAMRPILQRLAAGPASPLGLIQKDLSNGPYEDVSDASGAADHGSNSSSPSASKVSDQDDFHYEPSGQHFNCNAVIGMATEATTCNADNESDIPEGHGEEDDIVLHNVHEPGFLYPDNVAEMRAGEPDGKQHMHIRVIYDHPADHSLKSPTIFASN